LKMSRIEYRKKMHTQETIEELEAEGWKLTCISTYLDPMDSVSVAMLFQKEK
jgi:hypothetical protein